MNVIDISRWQKTLDAEKAKASGVQGVILRHAYGTTADTLAQSWAGKVHKSSLPVGGYGFATWHYLSKNNGDLKTARDLMRKQVNAWVTASYRSECDFWFAVDQELEQGQKMGILSKHDNTALLNEACDLLTEAGLHPCVYCSVSWDANYIRTSELRYPYWMARYYNGKADFGSVDACLDTLPSGKYTDFMRRLQDTGKLVGWQFASSGYGAKYGVGSENVDRNVFFRSPEQPEKPDPVPFEPKPDAQIVKIGPVSSGDQRTVAAEMERLGIPCHTDTDIVVSDVAVSTGDQVALIQLAAKLHVPIEMVDEKPETGYTVVYMAAVVKGGFDSEEDAVDYIESVLGKDAVKLYGVEVK